MNLIRSTKLAGRCYLISNESDPNLTKLHWQPPVQTLRSIQGQGVLNLAVGTVTVLLGRLGWILDNEERMAD